MRLIDWIIKMNSDHLRGDVSSGDPAILDRRG